MSGKGPSKNIGNRKPVSNTVRRSGGKASVGFVTLETGLWPSSRQNISRRAAEPAEVFFLNSQGSDSILDENARMVSDSVIFDPVPL